MKLPVMDRREFLATTGKPAAGSALASSVPAQALALSGESRRLLWYSSHCVGCGEPFEHPETLARTVEHHYFWCWLCVNIGGHPDFAAYRDNPPADFGPGPGWGLPRRLDSYRAP